MVKRDIVKRHYVVRSKTGQFKKWHRIGKSIKADSRKKVGNKRIPKTKSGRSKVGYGHIGDYKKR